MLNRIDRVAVTESGLHPGLARLVSQVEGDCAEHGIAVPRWLASTRVVRSSGPPGRPNQRRLSPGDPQNDGLRMYAPMTHLPAFYLKGLLHDLPT